MISTLFISLSLSLLFSFQPTFGLKLSDDFAAFIKPYNPATDIQLESNFLPNGTTYPQGWMQGIQYYNPTCSGTSFVTTNIATGVCVQDGLSSSYVQYLAIIPDSNPTTYLFYLDTFSDANCADGLTHANLGTIDPNYVCLIDTGNSSFSKTVYYYPGTTPPLYPYNGVLTSYLDNNDTCSGATLKSVILNPDTCYQNYNYNASDPNNYQSYTTSCDATYSLINTLFSDAACSVPHSINNSLYYIELDVCQSAIQFRQYGLPELYLLDNQDQFNYETAVSSCYTGPTVFLRNTRLLAIYDFILHMFDFHGFFF